MFPLLYLSDTASSIMQINLVLAIGMVVPLLLSPRNNLHRALLFGACGVLTIRYLHWRASETLAPFGLTLDCLASWSFFAIELGAALSSLSAFVILSRVRERKQEADRQANWWQGEAPRVAVLIPTYNEDREVLERTIVGALALDYPNFVIYVLDDSRRDWLEDYCASQAVRYFRRSDNAGAKAGNMNHALGRITETGEVPDFVAVLDADFVPHSNFLTRTVALLQEEAVGLVQTPQHFFNADPIQHNLGLSRSYPDEQRFFFDHIQPSRDAWDIAFCCGTSSVIRWSALEAIGGFPTESVTEDFLLSLCLKNAGYRSVYLNEALTEGLAPEGLREYITQRARWCLGQMQIARSKLGPFSRNNLGLADRWSVVDSVLFWSTTFPFRIAVLFFPLLYWYFNILVVEATLPEVLRYFGVYYLWILITLNFISGGLVVPVVNDISQLLGAVPITRAAYSGLFFARDRPFSVTAKGGNRSRVIVQWQLIVFFGALFLVTLTGMVLAIASDLFVFDDSGQSKVVIMFWTFYNLLVLGVTILVCIELPRRELHLGDRPERTYLRTAEGRVRVWIVGLTQNSVRIRGASVADDVPVEIEIEGVGPVRAVVTTPNVDGARLLLEPTPEQYQDLLKRFYTTGDVPSVTSTRYSALIADLARRLSRPQS
ncbi:glycosyltransferase [Roseibium salinum]|uniref:Glycosyltransferase n=1 Tax=Roseibium salinum TaxID=1604349 RepID=A0ABT3R1M1_9HYPH|nr:glycosyltransferase [Roseibium sp. DSM 29163]MCX2723141.1 glycosyltransferase [Roseibium sp. DSM 29163]